MAAFIGCHDTPLPEDIEKFLRIKANMTNCAFIGFGNAASAMAGGLHEAGFGEIFFHTRRYPTREHVKHAERSNSQFCHDYAALAEASKLIISCVTGSAAMEVASNMLPYLGPSHVYIDMNTASPDVKMAIGQLVNATGALFADAAIMGPVETFRHTVPIIACGNGAKYFHKVMTSFGMKITIIGGGPGNAARVKLLRSIFQKGLMSLFMETLAAARHYDVDDIVLSSICDTLTGVQPKEMAERMVTKAISKADRMTKEMGDASSMLAKDGLACTMSVASSQTLARCRNVSLGELPTLNGAITELERIFVASG